jgi:hypothetical protein
VSRPIFSGTVAREYFAYGLPLFETHMIVLFRKSHCNRLYFSKRPGLTTGTVPVQGLPAPAILWRVWGNAPAIPHFLFFKY